MSTVREFAHGLARFSLDLLGQLPEGNLALSPMSICGSLALAWYGARDETEAELRALLRQDVPAEHALRYLRDIAARIQKDAHGLTFRLPYRLFAEESYPIQPAFSKEFSEAVEKMPFRRAAEPARARINDWIADQTAQKIRDLLPPGSITADMRLVLVNALYLLARWAQVFPKHATQDQPFHLADGRTRQVPTMLSIGGYRLAKGDGYRTLQLPYEGGGLSMLILLPDAPDGLPALERTLTAERLGDIDRAGFREVRVQLPRFEVRLVASLAKPLAALGLELAATQGVADFRGIADPPDARERLFIAEIFHGAYVKVEEEGTEAAGATAVMMAMGGLPPPPRKPVAFVADHPFLFVIRHDLTGAVLFVGRVIDPTA